MVGCIADLASEMRRSVGVHHLVAVVLLAGLALLTLAEAAEAGITLSTNTDAVADPVAVLHLGPDTRCDSDDFVSDGQGVGGHALV